LLQKLKVAIAYKALSLGLNINTGDLPGKEFKGEEFLQKQGKGKRVNSN
jgi:hypothetical protein